MKKFVIKYKNIYSTLYGEKVVEAKSKTEAIKKFNRISLGQNLEIKEIEEEKLYENNRS